MNIFKSIMSWLFGFGKSSGKSDGVLSNRLYVGNISFNSNEGEIRSLFSKYGNVVSVSIIRNRFNGRPKGYAFVEMANAQEAIKALELSGNDFGGRKIVVSQAKEKKSGGRESFNRRREGGGRWRGKRRGSGRFRDKGREEVRDDRSRKKMERWEEEDHSTY